MRARCRLADGLGRFNSSTLLHRSFDRSFERERETEKYVVETWWRKVCCYMVVLWYSWFV